VRQVGSASRVGGLSITDIFLTLKDVKAWLTAVSISCSCKRF
jgi:hypothetical protein